MAMFSAAGLMLVWNASFMACLSHASLLMYAGVVPAPRAMSEPLTPMFSEFR